mmetsp:Transcript_33356/g.99567  ORF Transcript_33356/g.99567 Transcript_33356/m.99567 type:complete len:243 (+) Transcript_33356:186-914(+)
MQREILHGCGHRSLGAGRALLLRRRVLVAQLHLADELPQVRQLDLPIRVWVELLQHLLHLLCVRPLPLVHRLEREHQLLVREHAVAVQVDRVQRRADRAVCLLDLRAQRVHHDAHARVEHARNVGGALSLCLLDLGRALQPLRLELLPLLLLALQRARRGQRLHRRRDVAHLLPRQPGRLLLLHLLRRQLRRPVRQLARHRRPGGRGARLAAGQRPAGPAARLRQRRPLRLRFAPRLSPAGE